MFASDLVSALDRLGGFDQEVVLLRGPWPAAVAYAAPVFRMRANGRRLPGLRMDVSTLSSLRGAVARFRPHVLHAHGGEALKYSTLVATGRRTSVVYRRIGSAPNSIRHGIRRTVHRSMMRRSDRIVAVAEAVRRETVETFGIPHDHVVTIPRGVDPDRLRAGLGREAVRSELGVPASAPVTISVGALSPEKDPLAQVDLCERMLPSVPALVHLFVGDGPMREELDASVEARGLGEHVRLLGTRADIGDLLGASDVLVLSSLTEGMPGCLIEAGMAGLPAVAFDVAGVPEVLVEGVTGYVVEAGDHAALADRVLELLKDPDGREAMGVAARERCRSAFDIGSVARRYAEVYSEVARA